MSNFPLLATAALAVVAAGCAQSPPFAQASAAVKDPDARAAQIVDAMTLEERIQLLRPLESTTFERAPGASAFPAKFIKPLPPGALSSAAFVPAIPRLGWPAMQEADGPLGVQNMRGWYRGIDDQATALPASIAWAASFDPALAERAGRMMGGEAHAKGFNVMLAGGINLARDPRNGRNFEYAGEDPLLAGSIIGASIAGTQSRAVVSTIKHFALNDQESGRYVVDARIAEGAARESDLLAFEIAIARGQPGAVMCAYNRVNGDYACENDWLLNRVLKQDWGYRGWVMSDWGAVHSLHKAVMSGLDQHSPQDQDHFAGLAAAVKKGEIPAARVRDMALRIVRSMVAVGAVDRPVTRDGVIDREANSAVAQAQAEAGAVLLKNDGLLPLEGKQSIVVIGGHADKGVLAGNGSAQVNPWGGLWTEGDAVGLAAIGTRAFVRSSPLQALRALRPELAIDFDEGTDPVQAARAARKVDVAIVFALKAPTEGNDSADLSLGEQDGLIAAVAAANPRTIVVLETGNPVVMPWLRKVKAVLQAWLPGQRGGEAIAAILTGKVSPSGRLPITFPASVQQLPRPQLAGFDPKATAFSPPPPPFAVEHHEGSDVGYRWFERTGAKPLFPFGFGLTYTRFRHSDLKVDAGAELAVSFTVTNIGQRAGTDVPQLYVAPPGRTHRLAGWARVELQAGESRRVTLTAEPRILASWQNGGWSRAAGSYDVRVAPSASRSGLHAKATLGQR